MTIVELIERLDALREMFGDDAEVRLMTQEHYPFENGIAGVTDSESCNFSPTDAQVMDDDGELQPCVYIVEGAQIGYGTEKAWEVCDD